MAESSSSSSSSRIGRFSSGLAVLLSEEKPQGSSQNSHLISYFDDIGSHSVERTLEHIFDLPHKSIRPTDSLIDVPFIRSILKNHRLRLLPDTELECCRKCGLSIVDESSGSVSGLGKVVIDQTSIFGEMNIKEPLIVEGEATFSSARANACVWKGKWMYEVTLETSGVQQLGWATIMWPFTEWKGVGDVEDSYAYDGKRVSKWNKEAKPYGQPWVVGDVIGCCIDLDSNTISFSRNGVPLGIAFNGIRKMGPRVGYYPAISLSEGERCDLNFGARPFKYPIDGFLPIQAPPPSRNYAGYLLRCFTRLLEVQCLDKPDSAYFEKLRRLKRFAPLQEMFHPICRGILEEFFSLVHANEGCFQYVAWGELPLFFLGVFGAREPHDYVGLDQILDLFMEFPGSDLMLLQLIMALSYSCKVASLVLTECPYSGSYPYLALAIHILKRDSIMVLWWKSPYFDSSFEGFLSQKNPNKEDLHCLIPSVWWPGSCEDIGCESSMILITSALSGAINKIEQMHRELCTLVIYFVPPVSSSPQLPGSVFMEFLHNFLLRVRGAPHKIASSSVTSNSALVSLYTVILHFLSEGFCVDNMSCSTSNARVKSGFLHRGGKRSFPVELFFCYDSNSPGIPRIGRSENHVCPNQFDGERTKEIHWEEGCMDDESSRVTHLTKQKPCCCSTINYTMEQPARYYGQGSSISTKNACLATSERLTCVSTDRHMRSSSNGGIVNKPDSSVQSESNSGNGLLRQLDTLLANDQSSPDILREAELLDIMLLLYQLGVAPRFRQAFYYMSHQSQSISLLDDTDKQIRERSCLEQVKRLKEARNIYREELVDCVRQCAWYRIALFSWWKQRGMFATCMWIVQLLLILSNDDSIFPYVPEFYVESLVDSFHALRRSDPPFVSSATFIKHGLAPFVTFVVKHFNDPRILSADIKDLLLHSISAMVQCKDYLLAFESNKEAIESMPRGLLLAFDSRSWIPVTSILLRLFKGSGFFSSKHSESSSSVLFQVLLREACIHDESLFSIFLNRLFNTFSWTVTEFSMSIREMQGTSQNDLQQKKCSVVFDLSCSLARVLEFCTREIPQAFLLGSDMNLRRLTEVIIFVLNHIISAADAEFFDMSIRRSGQYQDKTNRTMILAPLVGMITNLMDASADPNQTELNDVVGVFASMDSCATVLFGFQYLLEYWSKILREDASLSKLAQLKKFACYLRSSVEAIERMATSSIIAGEEDDENTCCICYASECDAVFEPCHHRSCHDCITRHLLNGERCFFCNAAVSAVLKLEPGSYNLGESKKRMVTSYGSLFSSSCKLGAR